MTLSRRCASRGGWRGLLLAVLLVAGVLLQAQVPEDQVWQAYLQWLREAPPLAGPLDALKGFEGSRAAKGASPAEAARQKAVAWRLMNERTEAWPILFDRIYASDRPNFSQNPSPVLAAAVEGRTPGRALDVAMGQGRNTLFLAQRGWTVTGFDVSEEGLSVAKANAAQAGVTITAVKSSFDTFDYGTSRWDVIALIYVPAIAHEGAAMTRLQRALAPGGLLVIESFASDRTAPQRRPVDVDPAELKAVLSGFEILRFDDQEGLSEWDPQKTRLCRVIARKR